MAKAVQLAKDADAVIAVIGLGPEWETEGYDRTTLALPGRTDELVAKVAAANPKTIVVTQSVGPLFSFYYHFITCISIGFLDYFTLGGFCPCYCPLLVSW